MYDYLIVGAGFAGCVIGERLSTQLGKRCIIVEKRNHIGGNAYDYYDEHGILVHKYGPHLFHTNSKKVWDYLSAFTEWIPYQHKVLAVVDGIKVPLPFNLNSIDLLFKERQARRLEGLLSSKYGYDSKVPILKLRETSDGELKALADFVYEKIFYGYNLKQWGKKPEDLDPSVSGRVPVMVGRDDRYFQDRYQAMPKAGYTEMFKKIIEMANLEVVLNTDYRDVMVNGVKFDRLIYTGPIDEYFDYLHGELPYRSLRFEFACHQLEYFQEAGQINYPNDHQYTRITEFKRLTNQLSRNTTIAYEYAVKHMMGITEPYYPVPSLHSGDLYQKYVRELNKYRRTVITLGRLADYKYYNMDQVVARALAVFENEICRKS